MLFILISSFITVKSHGPAVTLEIKNIDNGTKYFVDLTLAFKLNDWPSEAQEWRMRRRGKSVTFLLFQQEDVMYFLN